MNLLLRAIRLGPIKVLKKLLGFNKEYCIAYRKCSPENNILNKAKDPFVVLPNTKDFWYADPSIVYDKENTYVFMEAFEKKEHIGRIAVSHFEKDGILSTPQVILKEPFHLSFPTIVRWNDKLYMIPETCQCNSLCIYECLQFPHQWNLYKPFDVGCKLVDTIVLEKTKEKLTLQTSTWQEPNFLNTKFQIYYLKNQDGTLTLEADQEFNSKQTFSTKNRNAGSLFSYKNSLVHPVQVSSDVQYGLYIDFWKYSGVEQIASEKITAIQPKDIVIEKINPKAVAGIHSYCSDGNYEVIDACCWRYSPAEPYYKINRKFKMAITSNRKRKTDSY